MSETRSCSRWAYEGEDGAVGGGGGGERAGGDDWIV